RGAVRARPGERGRAQVARDRPPRPVLVGHGPGPLVRAARGQYRTRPAVEAGRWLRPRPGTEPEHGSRRPDGGEGTGEEGEGQLPHNCASVARSPRTAAKHTSSTPTVNSLHAGEAVAAP